MSIGLAVENVRLRYRNGAFGVTDVSFCVAPGEVVVLLGANGSGKTTSLRSATGFISSEGHRVTHGTISLDGADMTNAPPHRVARAGVALVPERNKIFSNMTVAENLRAAGNLPRGQAGAAAFDRIFALFPALSDRTGRQAGLLSGGQQQMLSIARALLMNPRILLLDEVTLGLHHSLHEQIYSSVRGISESGTGVLLAEETAGPALDIADHVYQIVDGVTVNDCPANELALSRTPH